MKKLFCALLLSISCLAQEEEIEKDAKKTQPYMPPEPPPLQPVAAPTPSGPPAPWLTGTLIAPTGTVVGYGSFNIETYIYFTTNVGAYNKDWETVSAEENFYSLNPQIIAYFGLTPWCDINLIPQCFYNTKSNQHSFHFGDFTVGLDFQLLDAGYTPYFPGIKFAIREIFPTGHFERLNPTKLLTDQTGAGAFATQFDLQIYKEYHIYCDHWLSLNMGAQYTVNTPVHVHGFNSYGGGFGADGRALPGNILQLFASFEYSLTKNWALAIDNVYLHTEATQFCGFPGFSSPGVLATVGEPSSEQLSFAPAIEYNFSSDFGIIAGCWFTALGRNSTEFRSAVIEFDYTY